MRNGKVETVDHYLPNLSSSPNFGFFLLRFVFYGLWAGYFGDEKFAE